MPRPQYPMILTGKTSLSPGTVELEFQFENKAPFEYQAGQFIQLLFEHEGTLYKRSYSIANAPESFKSSGKLQIAISFVEGGMASTFFQNAILGTKVTLSGPFGVLTLTDEIPGKLVLVGTGTGIAPYRAMIPDLSELTYPATEIIILMGGRYKNEIIYQKDFKQLAINHPQIDYRVCLSRENPDNLKQGEYSGYVQHQFAELNLDSSKDIIFLCGNPGMVDDSATQLKEMLFDSKQIKREKYVYSGH